MKLLIAEDDPDMQKILKLYLQREGCQVNIVDNGRAAIDFLSENQVDLVILDWMIPVQDGIQTLKEIRLLNFPVKVLMLTAKGEIENEITGLTCGAEAAQPVRKAYHQSASADGTLFPAAFPSGICRFGYPYRR